MTPGYKTQIADILKATARIEERTRGLSREGFLRDRAALHLPWKKLLSRIGAAVGDLPEKSGGDIRGSTWAAWSGIGSPGATPSGTWRRRGCRTSETGERILFDITD